MEKVTILCYNSNLYRNMMQTAANGMYIYDSSSKRAVVFVSKDCKLVTDDNQVLSKIKVILVGEFIYNKKYFLVNNLL